MSSERETKSLVTPDNWSYHPEIPEGWKFQVDGSTVRFLTTDGSVLDSAEQVVDYMSKSAHSTGENYFGDDKNIEEETDGTVPIGWKVNEDSSIVSPTGILFKSRRIAFKEMMSDGGHSTADINKMKYFLKFEGWNESPDIPSGWLLWRGGRKVNLCDRTGRRFYSVVKASRFVHQNPELYSEDEAQILDNFGKCVPVKSSPENDGIEWNENDDTVPRGWKTKKLGSTGRVSLKDSEGILFSSRSEALLHLKTMNGSHEDIELIRESLVHDGWIKGALPQDWFYKRDTKGVYTFLTNTAQRIRGKTETVKFMRNNLIYNEEEIKNVENFGRTLEVEEKIRKSKKKSLDFDNSWLSDSLLPLGWRYKDIRDKKNVETKGLLSPDGTRFNGISSALRFLIKQNSSDQEISDMRNFMRKFGWKADPRLPKDWSVRKGVKRLDYCSPLGDVLKTRQQLEDYLQLNKSP